MINLKVIINKDYIVNICDNDLIGSMINNSIITTNFYGTICKKEEAVKQIKKATIINALGKESVNLVKKVRGNLKTMKINGIPHILLFTIT